MIYRKSYDAKTTVDDEAKGIVHAVISCYGVEDGDGDTMVQGAFTKSIQRMKAGGIAPVGLAYHDLRRPCAKTLDTFEENGEIHVVGQFNLEITDGREVFSNIKNRVITQYSHGFVSPVFERKGLGKRNIHDLDWREWSPVAVPSLHTTHTISVKELLRDGMTFADQSEAVLAAVEELLTRAETIQGLREKQGRVISKDSRASLLLLKERVNALCDRTVPVDVQAEVARFMAIKHALRSA